MNREKLGNGAGQPLQFAFKLGILLLCSLAHLEVKRFQATSLLSVSLTDVTVRFRSTESGWTDESSNPYLNLTNKSIINYFRIHDKPQESWPALGRFNFATVTHKSHGFIHLTANGFACWISNVSLQNTPERYPGHIGHEYVRLNGIWK